MIVRERAPQITGLAHATAFPFRLSERWRIFLFWTAILGGFFLRFVMLGRIPAGLNSDEAAAGVEALSLLQSSADRWGNHLPIYFPAWGSGMNVLYSYLSIPVIWGFGLNVVTIRIVGAVFGFLTIPVTYLAGRVHFGRDVALISAAFVAFLPWGVMSSRWALESNLLPFWFTLGIFTLGKALQAGSSPIWKISAFLPWSIGVYAYAASIFPAAASVVVIFYVFRRDFAANRHAFLLGVMLAVLICAPLIVFLLENALNADFQGFASIPHLPSSRLAQLHQSFVTTVARNIAFLLRGYQDGAVWNDSTYFPPLTSAAPFLTLIGVFMLAADWCKFGKPSIVLIVIAVIVVPICVVPLNVNRMNWFYAPSLMAAAYALQSLGRVGGKEYGKSPIVICAIVYFVSCVTLFSVYYFSSYNEELATEDVNLGNGFRIGIADALHDAVDNGREGEPIFIEIGTAHPYLYPLFYGLADIDQFKDTRQMKIEDGGFHVLSFDRFFFDRTALQVANSPSFVFVGRSNNPPCPAPRMIRQDALWAVGRCEGPPSKNNS